MTQFNETAPPLSGDEPLVQSRDAFAEIIAGRLPASVVHRDEKVLVITVFNSRALVFGAPFRIPTCAQIPIHFDTA